METKLGRGLFYEHAPADKQKKGQPNARHLRYMQFLNLHGCLSSSILFEREDMSYDAFKDSIKKLWWLREKVGEREGYIYRPNQQRITDNANYHDYVYALTEKGEKYLKRHGLFVEAMHPKSNGSADKWPHNFMISTITATIHIMCERSGYRYIPPHEFLEKRGRARIENVSFRYDDVRCEKNLTPDAVFAIEYEEGSFIAYALEADRATEPHAGKDWKRKTAKSSVLQYQELIGNGRYKDDYGWNCPLVVLYITVTPEMATAVLKQVTENVGTCRYITVGLLPEFAPPFWKPPKLPTYLFEEGLERAGREPFTIKKP